MSKSVDFPPKNGEREGLALKHFESAHEQCYQPSRERFELMTKTPKIFLRLSIVLFAISLTGPGSDIAWGLVKPLSAVIFILFLMFQILAKEIARYDQEIAASQPGGSPAAPSKVRANGSSDSVSNMSGRRVASH